MNYFAIGFAGLAALTAGALDYSLHLYRGEAASGSYMASVQSRMGTLVAKGMADAPPEVLASQHLPLAPAGWERRAFDLGATGTLAHGDMDEIEEVLLTSFDDSPLFSALNKGEASNKNDRAAREVFEYIRPAAYIRLGAAHAERSGKVFREKLMRDPKSTDVTLSFGAPEVFGVVQGVIFYVAKRDAFDSTPVIPGSKPLFLRGYIGDDIRLTVYAQAPAEALVQMLNAIDYDALNAMQARPATAVGSALGPMPDAQKRLLLARAKQLFAARGGSLSEADPSASKASSGSNAAHSATTTATATTPKRLTLSGSDCSTGTFCGAAN